MLNVYLTMDTEIWWSKPDLSAIKEDYQRWFLGRSNKGEFGVPHQIKVLDNYGLKGVYFIEPLCALAAGQALVDDMVAIVQGAGHDVQLHLHSEWLALDACTHTDLQGINLENCEHIRCF